jgi:hypothetical protein
MVRLQGDYPDCTNRCITGRTGRRRLVQSLAWERLTGIDYT